MEVVDASFPDDQKLAQSSDLEIKVRNAGDRAIPNVAMTVEGSTTRSPTTPSSPIARGRCS